MGHGGLPFIDAGEQRFGIERWAKDLTQIVADNSQNLIFAVLQDLFVACTSEKAADESAILRGPVGKFVVNESRGQDATARAARNQKSEARWKSAADFFAVAERDCHRRTVLNLPQFTG